MLFYNYPSNQRVIVNFFLTLLYDIILYLLALLALPKMLFSFLFQKKYRQNFLPRLGIRYPEFRSRALPSIWIHAVSVGETKAIVKLARDLKRRYPDNSLIISTTTETGHEEAKRSLPFADYYVYLPFDFCWLTQRIVKKANPGLVIFSETDFWYNFLYYSKKNGAAIALVNGKLSERSMRRFSLVPSFSKALFGLFDVFCLQNTLYRGRFIEAGALEEKIIVTGNLKLDDDYPQLSNDEVMQWRQKLGIQSNQLVLTIGSTHSPEEKLFIQVLKEIWKTKPDLRVVMVPRHPERFVEVGRLLEKERLRWINFSDINRRTGKEQVILIDAMGLLRMCYQLSDFAIVAGSYTDRVGGHNILEPCWYGKPVLFGPHMSTQVELVDLMMQYRAGRQVGEDDLLAILREWVEHPEGTKEMGMNGLRLIKDLRGSTMRTINPLEPYLVKLH